MVASYGFVTIVTPGTPVQLTSNAATPSNRVGAQSVQVQALPANAGVVYVGLKGMVRSTGVGVLAILPKPTSATTGPFPSASFSLPFEMTGLNLADFYIDGASASDGVVVTITAG